jgi:hypothetical protein
MHDTGLDMVVRNQLQEAKQTMRGKYLVVRFTSDDNLLSHHSTFPIECQGLL